LLSDLFRSTLEAIIDPEHELLRLAELIDWARFDDAFGRPPLTEPLGRCELICACVVPPQFWDVGSLCFQRDGCAETNFVEYSYDLHAPFAEAVATTGGRSVRHYERNLELDAQDLDGIRTNLAGGPG